MTGPEHFLSRWSRKKLEEKQEQTTDEVRAAATPPGDAASAAPPPADRAAGERGPPVATPPAFDPASLPSIDSIGAQTDIGAFLKPGVPTELRHAALRRAWSVDPAIRDFKGLQENDWDFNDPNGIPGFGPLSAELDVKKMAAALFGAPSKENPAVPVAEPAHDDAARPLEPDGAQPVESDASNFVRREENIALRDKKSETDSVPVAPRRRGGGALPQ